MAFGLLTAINIEDVPKILYRVAQGYRGTETKRFPVAWVKVADEIERFAKELEPFIEEAKANEPKPKRERVKLHD